MSVSDSNAAGTSFVRSLLDAWSWLFLILILAFFEIYAQTQTGSTFLFRIYNLQSISIAASQILILALGLTLVIVAGHIDLSIAFSTGFAAVTMALVIRAAGDDPSLAMVILAMLVGLVAALSVGA